MASSPSRAGRAPAAPLGRAEGWARAREGAGEHACALLTLLLPRLQKKFVNNLRFDVTFTFSRLPLQVQHRAATLAMQRGLSSLLFPSASCHKSLFTGTFQPQ